MTETEDDPRVQKIEAENMVEETEMEVDDGDAAGAKFPELSSGWDHVG